jgi:hypothetical protein
MAKIKKGGENHHYVPKWYQRLFISNDRPQKLLHTLRVQRDPANPKTFLQSRPDPKPTKHIFCAENLYTANIPGIAPNDIERVFFGKIDDQGKRACSSLAKFTPGKDWGFFDAVITFLCTQRFRTPRGLGFVHSLDKRMTREDVFRAMIGFQKIYGAVWAECIWQIADASKSPTKFIISDNPVTLYNRAWAPEYILGPGVGEPDIRWNGTHALFPLHINKVLILTHLSWVRNPYGDPKTVRPNPNLRRNAIFMPLKIQTERLLDETEVQQINLIIKNNSDGMIAGDKPEWLFPERHVDLSHWGQWGNGYLLMPDPRSVSFHRQLYIGYKDGTSTAFDEYGRRPWDEGYGDENNAALESASFRRFQGEYARLFGPRRRGRASDFGRPDPEEDSPEYHKAILQQEQYYKEK